MANPPLKPEETHVAKVTIQAPQPKQEQVQSKTRMIMNKGHRAFHAKPESVLSGGEVSWDKKYVCINQGSTVEVSEEFAKRLLRQYPTEIIDVSKGK